MPTIANWISSQMTATNRATDALARILDKPSSVIIRRGSTNLSAQTVRLEYGSTTSPGEAGVASVNSQRVVIFGIRDHETEADTDIQRADRFTDDDGEWEIDQVILTPGEVQAVGRRIS